MIMTVFLLFTVTLMSVDLMSDCPPGGTEMNVKCYDTVPYGFSEVQTEYYTKSKRTCDISQCQYKWHHDPLETEKQDCKYCITAEE